MNTYSTVYYPHYCLFSLFMPFLIPVYTFFYLLTCYMHMHFSVYSYTFIRSSDSLDLHIQIYNYLLLIRYWERITNILRSRSSLLLDHLFSIFFVTSLFHCFHDSMYWTHTCSIPLFIYYHVWMFICDIAVMLIYHSGYIAYSG